jgi:hypothetical protein
MEISYKTFSWKTSWEEIIFEHTPWVEDVIKTCPKQTGCGLDSTGSRQCPIAGTFELTFEFQKNLKLLHQSVSIF